MDNEIVRIRELEFKRELLRIVSESFTVVMHSKGITYWQRPRDKDLLRWLQWSRILGIRSMDVISRVTDHYRKIFRKTDRALGINIATLSGPAAWAWLQGEFKGQVRSTVPAGRIRRRYASLEDYHAEMYLNRIRKARSAKRGLTYRGSPRWSGPKLSEDAILQAFGYTGLER